MLTVKMGDEANTWNNESQSAMRTPEIVTPDKGPIISDFTGLRKRLI
jgi:hypothetical protein